MSQRGAPIRPRYERGFWAWAERQVLSLQSDPEKRARVFRIVWLLSLAFIAVGVFYIFLALKGVPIG